MKRNLLAAAVALGLAASMVTGSLYTVNSTGTVYAAETAVQQANRMWDLTGAGTEERPSLEGSPGEYDGIRIDATNGKFSPREGDTQVNAGTILTIPVEANSDGATVKINLSGGTASVRVGEQIYASEGTQVLIPLQASESETECEVTFDAQAYLSSIELSYNEPAEEYPGVPEDVQATDVSYTFDSTEGLLDENGAAPADSTLQGDKGKGTFGDIKVDATEGKFAVQPANSRVQINAGTVLYIPVAYDDAGAELLIAGTTDGSTPANIKVNGESTKTNEKITLDMSDESAYPQYIAVEFAEEVYVTEISLNYASDSDYDTPVVEAKDKVWDFTESSAVERPTVQGAKDEFDGIQIDATTGKFAPRTTATGGNDTQVTAGTTLYIPIAPDENGASITVSGNNYNNLTLKLNGEVISVGTETELPRVEENSYVALEFSSADGTGSCYLSNISVDYMSDNEVNLNTVTVGEGYDYSTIQAALDANESSASNPLVIQIAPGKYTEKVTVDKPWVSFQPLDSDGGEIILWKNNFLMTRFLLKT